MQIVHNEPRRSGKATKRKNWLKNNPEEAISLASLLMYQPERVNYSETWTRINLELSIDSNSIILSGEAIGSNSIIISKN